MSQQAWLSRRSMRSHAGDPQIGCDRDHCTPEERAVIDAVVARRQAQVPFKKIAAYEMAWNAENDAVDALIAAREAVEGKE